MRCLNRLKNCCLMHLNYYLILMKYIYHHCLTNLNVLIVLIRFWKYFPFKCFKHHFYSFKKCHCTIWCILFYFFKIIINLWLCFSFILFNILCQMVLLIIWHTHINNIISNFILKKAYCFKFSKITSFIISFINNFASISFFFFFFNSFYLINNFRI